MNITREPAARGALIDTSLELIEAGQARSGAYLAAPDYDTYAYCWLRDGAFIATAMDAYGRAESAAGFHAWVARTVERHRGKVEALEQAIADADHDPDPLQVLDERLTLHTRFTPEGDEGDEPWGDVQLDGYGFWLTSVAAHLAHAGASVEPYAAAIDLVRRYLESAWEHPCYDSWEEYPGRRHVTTWAAIARGLQATRGLTGDDSSATSDAIRARLSELAGPDRILRKFVPGEASIAVAQTEGGPGHAVAGHERVGRRLDPDAIDGGSLLVLGPAGPFEPDDPIVSATLRAVESSLVVDGGVHRYLDDEYYGGGLWVVLAGALAVVVAPRATARAESVLRWIEDQADERGHLPEQVASHLRRPDAEAAWVERWGPPARPLLWSHAMYLLGVDAVARASSIIPR